MAKLTPKERLYATAKKTTEQQKTDANWRYEGLHVMLWALGYLDSLVYPSRMCNVQADVKIVVYERHYALNWLMNYLGQAWDDVSTDT
jgi:Domain of unknown function (DUF4272)